MHSEITFQGDGAALLDEAENFLSDGRFEEALHAVRSLQGRSLESSLRGRALAIEVLVLESMNRDDEARQITLDTMQIEGDDHAFVLAAGVTFSDFEVGEYAEIFLRNLCDMDPKNPVAWYNLAISLGRDGRYKEAIDAYDTLLECDQDFAEAYMQRGFCLSILGMREKATASYQHYLSLEPDDGEAILALAALHSEDGMHLEADALYARALTCHEDPFAVLFQWATTAILRDDVAKAASCLEQMEHHAQDDWRTLVIRSECAESSGEIWPAWETIAEAVDAALETEDSDAIAYASVAAAEFAIRNDMDERLTELTQYLYGQDSLPEEYLEVILYNYGRSADQVRSYQVALRATARTDGEQETQPWPCLVYGVYGENENEALREVLSFEETYGPYTWHVDSIHPLAEPDEGIVGIYWRSGHLESLPEPPGNDNE